MPFVPPPAHLNRPLLTGSFGMVATTHWIASAVAQAVLERGGNAYDAVVAAGFVLHLAEPHLNGAGGDLVGLISPAGGSTQVVVGQGPAPGKATIEHYRSLGVESVPGSGALAAAVPGAVPAWLWLLREHGTWDIADALAYAIHYAEVGQALVPQASATIASVANLFIEHWPTSAATWLVDGQVPPPGHVMKQPVYARTLRRLLQAADAAGSDRIARIDAVRREWSAGFVAQAIAEFAARPHRHSDGGDYAGVIDAADLAGFEIAVEQPLRLTFRGTTVAKPGFWAQSPVLLQALAILDHFDDAALDPSTERGAHTVIEAIKLAMADRDAYYGDVRGDHELLRHLLTAEYAKDRAALITEQSAGDWRPGRVPGVTPYFPPLRTLDQFSALPEGAAGTGEPTVRPSGETRGDTVHLDIVDPWGNFVSATPSGGWLQSNPTIPQLGFCLGTRLQMTWLDPESPSALRPGARPRTTLTPTILERDGATVSALGSPGGDQQDQWQLLYLLRRLVGGYHPQQAIEAPMFTVTAVAQSFWPREWTPRGVLVEERLGTDVIEGLRRRGHEVTVLGPWSLARLTAVERDPVTGLVSAAANPRGAQGYAAGRLRIATALRLASKRENCNLRSRYWMQSCLS
jgi:gamma-glutamyltranspeptidase / glutathione hydrolase